MKRISNIITIDEIKTWKNTDLITITAGTGSGKSYFIKNILYAFAEKRNKKILMLIHRTNCVNQFQQEIEQDNKTDIIDIKTYQALESIVYNQKTNFDFSKYEYIVCDEFHYFLNDAIFNKTTDISLDLVLSQINTIRIFMSATGNCIKQYLNDIKELVTIDYELPVEYSFIDELTFFNKYESMEEIIRQAIEKSEKSIFFIQSAKRAYDLYEKYEEHCLFNCSKGNKKFYKYVDQAKIDSMLANEKFKELILVTTSCLDSGVNINDTDVKHILCDIKDISSLLQCIGRRRVQNKGDKFNLYIKTIHNQQLAGIKTQLEKKIKMAEYLKEHTVQEYIQEYSRKNDYSNIVYDDTVGEKNKGTKRINELMYFKYKLDIDDIAIMQEYGEFGYCKYLKNLFKYNRKYRLMEEDYGQNKLEKYLESIVGRKLYKDDQKELINKIGLKDSRGRLQKGIRQFNAYFEENEIPFIIKSERKSIRVSGKIKKDSFWMIYKLTSIVDENLDKAI